MDKHTQPVKKLDLKKWIRLLPVIIMLGIAPIGMYFFRVHYPAYPVNWKLGDSVVDDFFTYGKFQLILASGILSFLFLMVHIKNNSLKDKGKTKPLFLIGTTMIWLLLTTVTAKFPHAALWGMLEKFEGVFVWLSYIIFALYIGSLSRIKSNRIVILRTILFSGLLVTGVGLSQYIGHDLIRMDWFKLLIMPKEVADALEYSFEINRVYATLYNPNFVAMYVATVMPLALFMIFREESALFKGLWSLFCGLLVVNLIGSNSSGGIAGIFISLGILCFIFLIRKLSIKMQRLLTISAVSVTIATLVVFLCGGLNGIMNIPKFAPEVNMTNISTKDYQTIIEYKGKKLIAATNPETLNSVQFYTEDQHQVQMPLNVRKTPNSDGYYIDSPDFSEVFFTTGATKNGFAYINFKIDNVHWIFLLHPNGMKYVNGASTTVPFEASKGSGGFVGHEGFGSARGFIWSRTLPLITESPIVGYGADNFTVAFPQNDYNLKYKLYGKPNTLVDKAHNLFLQLIMNFGIPGIMLLLSIIGYSVRCLYRAYYVKENADYKLNLVLILCIFGYLGSGLFYDSNLHVSPFFWTFVGFGLKDVLVPDCTD